MTAATRSSCWVDGSTLATRWRTTSPIVVGRSSPPPAATSSSTKNGLPSARSTIRSSSPRCRRRADDPTDQLADLLGAERTEVTCTARPERTSSPRATVSPSTRSPSDGRRDATTMTRRRAHRVGHEQQEVAGRLVGPLKVLDDDDERLGRRPRRRADRRPRRRTGSDPPGRRPRGLGRRSLLARRQVAEDLGERRVRNGVGERQAGRR